MTIRWNRESILVSLVVIMILIAIGYYGYRHLVEPERANAESSQRIVNEQNALLSEYPPEPSLLEDYQMENQEIVNFIPASETINEAIVTLETTANNQNVDLSSVTRMNAQESIEELPDEFVKSVYQVEVESNSAENIREFIRSLMDEERISSVSSLTVQKQGEGIYNGQFTLELVYRQMSE